MKDFIAKNWVLISGLIAAAILVLQQFIGVPSFTWPTVAMAMLMAIIGVIANEWRGKGVTVLGMIGTLCYTFLQVYQGGSIDWNQFALMAILSILTAISPPPKSAKYEQSPTILNAKRK